MDIKQLRYFVEVAQLYRRGRCSVRDAARVVATDCRP